MAIHDQGISLMPHHSLTIIDDFFPDGNDVRSYALEHDFTGGTKMDGHTYPGTIQPRGPSFKDWFGAHLQNAVGRPIVIKGCAFVLGREGQFTEQWIHADTIGSTHAAVCYLFDGHHKHGTAFWRHLESNCTQQDGLFLAAMGVKMDDEKAMEDLAARVRLEGEQQSAWQMAGFTEARFNRLVFYPSSSFHSRYPREAFGTTPEDGRLVLVAFFTIT